MKLATWLAREGTKRKDFADRIGVTPPYITALCAEEAVPSLDVAQRIETLTNGEVTPQDFYRDHAA